MILCLVDLDIRINLKIIEITIMVKKIINRTDRDYLCWILTYIIIIIAIIIVIETVCIRKI
jgi:hypothetical protein